MPSLVLLFSSLWVAYLASMGFDFNVVAPLLLAAFPLCLAMGYSFFGGLHPPPVNGCSAGICVVGALAEDEHTSFYSTVLLQERAFFCHVLFN